MSATGVWTALPAYRVARAELPLTAFAAGSAQGAVAVADGADVALAALGDGAAALVLTSVDELSIRDIDLVAAAAAGIPLVVDRRRLRADVMADARRAGSAVRLLAAEAAGPAQDRVGLARDAVGWLRVLAGDRLSFVSRSVSAGGMLALFESEGGDRIPAALTLTSTSAAPTVRVNAVGEVRTEIDIDDITRSAVLTETSVDGTRTAPARREWPARLALRRAIAALGEGEILPDLDELRHDAVLAQRLLSGHPPLA